MLMLPDRLLTEKEAALYLNISVFWLQRMRFVVRDRLGSV